MLVVSSNAPWQSGCQEEKEALSLSKSTQAQDQVQSRLLLDVVVGQGAAIL